ncbi:MAG: FKBP-type peptidyl-prolyl cis-trans isomerase N-terminal domain-containing protein [Methylococcales bacterium]|nr:FKBP-type peptidyl-prolyl cis-trans isomerase N-terminal domain-containing protein [Methylococcales bacterium]
MRILTCILLALCLTSVAHGEDENTATDNMDRNADYALGWQYMHNLKEDGLQLDTAAFLEGLEDAGSGKASRLTEQENRKSLDYVLARRQLNRQAKTEQMLKEGHAYLEENGKREGVITLPSGVQYKVLQHGGGAASPTAEDGVNVRFVVRDLQNRELGRNLDEQPQKTWMKALIPGWREALQRMKPGDRWEISLSPNLAYGVGGSQNRAVKPNQTLVTELELVDIIPAETMKAEQEQARQAQRDKPEVVPGSQFSFSK